MRSVQELSFRTVQSSTQWEVTIRHRTRNSPVMGFRGHLDNADRVVSLTQPLLYAKFKWQDTKSFQPDAYGGGMQIVVDERNRLLHADLSGFKSTVNLSHDYPVFQYASGVKPSKAVSLGCLWALPVGNWAKQATWNANGTIMVVGGLSNGDRCMHTPRTLPIPDGVTFS